MILVKYYNSSGCTLNPLVVQGVDNSQLTLFLTCFKITLLFLLLMHVLLRKCDEGMVRSRVTVVTRLQNRESPLHLIPSFFYLYTYIIGIYHLTFKKDLGCKLLYLKFWCVGKAVYSIVHNFGLWCLTMNATKINSRNKK